MKHLLILLFCLTNLLASCHYFGGESVKGDGNITAITHNLSDFEGVEVSGAIELYLEQGTGFRVKLEADNNLHEFIEVVEDGGKLKVRPANYANLDPTRKIKVYVSAPSYKNIAVSGACSIKSETALSSEGRIDIDLSGASNVNLEVKAENLTVETSGSSEIYLRGQTKSVSIRASGSTSVRAFDLLADNIEIDISGAGDVDVYANTKLDARVSGASSIRYKGEATVSKKVSGSGRIKKVD